MSQLQFEITGDDGFASVLAKCLDACQTIFESKVSRILSGNYRIVMVEASREAYSYKDVPTLCTGVDEARLSRAIDFGPYAASFPKLRAIVESVRRSRLP